MIKRIEKLSEILDGKKNLLDNFYKLTLVQKKLIASDDIDKLNRIIRNKEELIGKINTLDRDFLEIYSGLKKDSGVDNLTDLPVDREYLLDLKARTNSCDSLMKLIKRSDEENNELMKKSFENVKKNLREIKRGKTTTSKYYNKAQQSGGYFIDSKK